MSKYKLLIIDDNWKARQLSYKLVLENSFDIIAIEKPEELFLQIQNIAVDGYVIDIVLNGWTYEDKDLELFHVLDAIGTGKPIILISDQYLNLAITPKLTSLFNRVLKKNFRVVHFLNWSEFQIDADEKTISDSATLTTTTKITLELDRFIKETGAVKVADKQDVKTRDFSKEELSQAQEVRTIWNGVITDQIRGMVKEFNREVYKAYEHWYQYPLDKHEYQHFQISKWNVLAPIIENKKLLKDHVELDHLKSEAGLYDFRTNTWFLDDAFCVALRSRFKEEEGIKRSARLFFFHETLHLHQHNLDGNKAQGIGLFPRVIEEADYEADIYALLHEYWFSHSRDAKSGFESNRFASIVECIINTMWAFDDRGVDIEEIEIRRFNRYLIWYLIWVQVDRADSSSEIFELLANKPIIEYQGAQTIVRNQRTYFNLRKQSGMPQFASYVAGKIKRASTQYTDQIRKGFKHRDGQCIYTAIESFLYS